MIDIKKLIFRCIIYILVFVGSIGCVVFLWNVMHPNSRDRIEKEDKYILTTTNIITYEYENNTYAIAKIPGIQSNGKEIFGLFMKLEQEKDSYLLLGEMDDFNEKHENTIKQVEEKLYVLTDTYPGIMIFSLQGKKTKMESFSFVYDGVRYVDGKMNEDKENKFKHLEEILDVNKNTIYVRGENSFANKTNYSCSLKDYKCNVE